MINIEQRREYAIKTESFWGFDSQFAIRARGLVYDAIDYKSGPSDLAEKSAKRTGYWNLDFAYKLADTMCDLFMVNEKKDAARLKDKKMLKDILEKEKQYRKVILPFVFRECQVKKY